MTTTEPWARISVCRTRSGRPVLLKLDPTILLMAGISPTGFACVFGGRDGKSLMLSGAVEQDYDAAPIKYTRGRYVRVHWVRSGILAGMFPSEMVSTTVPVIRASNGQVVLDVSEIVSKRRWERSLTQRVPPSTKTALGEVSKPSQSSLTCNHTFTPPAPGCAVHVRCSSTPAR